MELLHLGAKEIITNMKEPQIMWDPKDTRSPRNGFGAFGGLAYKLMGSQAKEAKLTTWTFVAQVPHKVMVAKF